MTTSQLIELWREVYYRYLDNCDVDPNKHEECWIRRTNEIITFYTDINESRGDFIKTLWYQIDHYQRINTYYDEVGRKPVDPVINTDKRRYWA